MSAIEQEVASQPAVWREAARLETGAALPRHGARVAVDRLRHVALRRARRTRRSREAAGLRRDGRVPGVGVPGRPRLRRACSRSRGRARRPRCSTPSRVIGERAPTVAITAVADSPLARAAGRVVTLPFADERSVVQTRFATAALVLLRAHLGIDSAAGRRAPPRTSSRGRSRSTPPAFDRFHFLGRGWTVGLAHEAALKLREAARAWSEAYPAMEYRHGPIATADSRTLVVPIGALDPDLESDIRATGATPPRTGGGAARLARPRPPARDRARTCARARPVKPPQPDTIGGAPMRRSLLLVAALAARPRRRLRRLGLRLVERRPGQRRALARVRRRRGQGARRRREEASTRRTPRSTSPSRTTATPTTPSRRC